jgi:peptidoglycan/xylan/chitin deacetylase (PgdA/CDA1 family)
VTLKRTLAVCALLVSAVVPAADGAAQVVRSGPSSCKAVALTFDMCPVREGAGYDAPLIDMLMERRIPATFFLSGRWIVKHEAEVKALLTVPFFEVGTHGQVHAHLPALDADHQRAEISRPVLTLQKRYGYRGLLFRPPYGEYDDTTVEIAQALGLQFILWSAVSGDPDPRLSPDRMLEDLRTRVHGGGIVVFHANGKGVHTRAVVEDLSQELLKKGLQPVTVTELLGRCNASADHDPITSNR